MNKFSIKKEILGTLDLAIEATTVALKAEGFGILTRIDFHNKVKEKLDKDLRPIVILGACNPLLAFEAYQKNSDVAALLPCNVVLREIADKRISIEIVKPSSLMKILDCEEIQKMAVDADTSLERVLNHIKVPNPRT